MKTMRERLMGYFSKTNHGFDTLTGFDFEKQEPLIRSKAIRAKCLECQNGVSGEVASCQITDCALWPWRFGRRLKPHEARKVDLEALGSVSGD